MEKQLKELFQEKWSKYFPGVGLPVTYYYTDEADDDDLADSENKYRCLIGNLNRVREGHTFVYSAKSPGCAGGKRYTGYVQKLIPDFEYFLSCGIPGRLDGERYKKSPELVKEYLKNHPPYKAPARFLVFKRWDKNSERDNPAAVIFFALADVLSGLFTLANFDTVDPYGVTAPMGSGCSSIMYPYEEMESDKPKCVLGMFDVSARPYVPENMLTFTVPIKRFMQMVYNMDESFLITESWNIVKQRINGDDPAA